MCPSLRLALPLAAVLLTGAPALGQQLSDARPDGVVRTRGWVIPNLRNFGDRERVPVMTVGAEGKHAVYATELDLPENGGILLWDAAYYKVRNGKRSLHASPIDARSITKLDVDGRVFAYVAYGTGVAIQKLSRPRSASTFIHLGCIMGYAYYDLDGDGKFELLATSEGVRGAKLFIPPWVLQDRRTATR